ncbi:carbohydrate binding domain-containing protein [Pontibacillus yanchengensis]|uniref:carbohydrate binding domain-containing protein n=1 Tax=Pontibacillus yanchengensis TaxID=462910 RepID=UPI00056C60A3|nr:carbohydrate binding domain-containing protein [Pontibacillus yanchengensis]
MLGKRVWILVLIVLLCVVNSVSIQAGEKNKESNEDVSHVMDVLPNQKKNGNAALSNVEVLAMMNHLFVKQDNGEGKWEDSVLHNAIDAGYLGETLGADVSPNAAIKTEEALSVFNYLLPFDESILDDQTWNGNKPMKRKDVSHLLEEAFDSLITEEGTYEDQTMEGNVLLTTDDVTLKNSVIQGDLIITAGAAPGNIELHNVTVEGDVYVHKAVENDVKFVNSDVKQVVVYEYGDKKSDWSLVWSDEFMTEDIDESKWQYDIGNWIVDENGNGVAPGWGNNESEYYTDSDENSYIEDGKLVIKAQKEEEPITDKFGSYDYSSAKLKTKDLFSKKYGKFEARMKLPEGQGYWPAFWMMPEDSVYGDWPASGEIDIMEAAGNDTKTIGGTIHYGEESPNNTYNGEEYHFPEGEDFTGYHTYSIEWEPGEIRWYVDGELYQTLNKWFSKSPGQAAKNAFPAPFDQEFYIILNLAVGGWYGGEPDETTEFPGKMKVDYVRVYELTGRDYMTPEEPTVEDVELPEDAKQPKEDGNYIYDQDYSNGFTIVDENGDQPDPTYWNFLTLPDFAGEGSISTEEIDGDTFAKTSITNPGNALWSLQQIQHLSIAEGGTYKVTFDAKSNTSRNIMSKVSGGAERGYANYSGEKTMNLTDEVQTYEYTFTMNQENDLAARLEFNMGANGTAPVWIGNVRVEDITGEQEPMNEKEPLPTGNHVYNGTFDQGDMSRMIFWDFHDKEGASAEASVDADTRELKVDIANTDNNPESIQLKQTGLQLLEENEYELTFDARAASDRTIQVDVLSKDSSQSYSTKTVELSEDMATHKVTFTMPTDITDREGQLVFQLGGAEADVFLDNVKLVQPVDLHPLKNGDFTSGMDSWVPYIHFDANAEVGVQDGELQVDIANAGNETWSVLLEQPNMKFSKDVTYKVRFDARSTMSRDIEVTLENANYTRYLSEKVTLEEDMKTYSFELKMSQDDTVALKFLMGQFAEEHDIYIDNVDVEVVK